MNDHPLTRRYRPRRGAAAIEFAMTLPLLVAIIAATADYGWYFLRQGMVANSLREAVRAGAFQAPDADVDVTGECSPCLERTVTVAQAELQELGITVADSEVTPTISSISGTCALVLDPNIPYPSLIGLVPVPTTYRVRVVAYAQNITSC